MPEPPAPWFRTTTLQSLQVQIGLRQVLRHHWKLRSLVKSSNLNDNPLSRASVLLIAPEIFHSRVVTFLLLVLAKGKRKEDRLVVHFWALVRAQHHLICLPFIVLLNQVSWEMFLPDCLDMLRQKSSLLREEVCALCCLEEPRQVAVEVFNDKVCKVLKGLELVAKEVLMKVITGKKVPEEQRVMSDLK